MVGELIGGWQDQVVLARSCELIDELLCALGHASMSLHGEGNKVSRLRVRHLCVLGLLHGSGLVGDGEGCAAGCVHMGGSRGVRHNDISEDGARSDDDRERGLYVRPRRQAAADSNSVSKGGPEDDRD